jgi:thiamine-phosphate pyrophosphorylase
MRIVFPPLYVIVDMDLLEASGLSFARQMAESGVELLQVRAKHATPRHVFETCRQLSAALADLALDSSRRPRLIVNDRPDIAALAPTDGVHVGQNDLDVESARAIVGRDIWVGVSTHNLEQVGAADQTSADYIAFGPVFPTATKEHPDPVVGLELLSQARARTRKPLVAIGGITLERAAEAYRAGVDSLAVARDLARAADPRAQARAFLGIAAAAGKHSQAEN